MPHQGKSAELSARRGWATRTRGAQKKFHEIHWIFDVVTAVLVWKDGSLDVYESEPGFLKSLPDVMSTRKTTRENFLTLEDQVRGPPEIKNLNKAWNSRTSNAMKKLHEIHALYGAQTAGLIFDEKEGELMVYESQRGFITLPDGVQTVQRIPAEGFTRLCDLQKSTKPGPRQNLPPVAGCDLASPDRPHHGAVCACRPPPLPISSSSQVGYSPSIPASTRQPRSPVSLSFACATLPQSILDKPTSIEPPHETVAPQEEPLGLQHSFYAQGDVSGAHACPQPRPGGRLHAQLCAQPARRAEAARGSRCRRRHPAAGLLRGRPEPPRRPPVPATQPSVFQHRRTAEPVNTMSDISDYGNGEFRETAVKWSVRLNADALMEGRTDFVHQYPDK